MIALQHKTTLHILRILIGLVFITSAIFKLIGIDAFEVYMFSLQWFNLPVASVIARLIISVEFIIGIFFQLIPLLIKIYMTHFEELIRIILKMKPVQAQKLTYSVRY